MSERARSDACERDNRCSDIARGYTFPLVTVCGPEKDRERECGREREREWYVWLLKILPRCTARACTLSTEKRQRACVCVGEGEKKVWHKGRKSVTASLPTNIFVYKQTGTSSPRVCGFFFWCVDGFSFLIFLSLKLFFFFFPFSYL